MRLTIWSATVTVCLTLTAMPAWPGEQLTPLMLARQADAAAVVEVRFRAGAPEILVERWLLGGPVQADATWIGVCLPGAALLREAVLRAVAVSRNAGVRALLVHALHERARQFYEHHGFQPSPTHPMTHMLPLGCVKV